MTTPSAIERTRDLLNRAGSRASRQALDLGRRISTPALQLVKALRGEGQTEGMRHLPQEGPAIIAANHRHRLDGRALVAALPRPAVVVSTSELQSNVRTRRKGERPFRKDAWDEALAVLVAGGVVVIFPEGEPSPDTDLHKGRDAVGRLVVAANVPVVPAVLDTRHALLLLGPRLEFSRYRGLSVDRTLARGVTDEIMSAIADLGRLRYVDTYPSTARDQLRSAAQTRRDQFKARVAERKLGEQHAIEVRRAEELEERRDLARLHREAEAEAEELARVAAERDRQRRVERSAAPQQDGPLEDGS